MASYINNYDDAADYSADASARAALGKSTVSLEADSGKVLAAGKEGEPTWADCEGGGIPLEDGESIIVSKEN